MSLEDIRDLARIASADVLALNFIRSDAPYIFRAHFRSGLRSRIMEMISPAALAREREGVMVDGLRCFPRARPVKMLRIFRRRFSRLDEALEETRRLKILEAHLAPEFIARSSEFYVDYHRGPHREILLCGIQEPVCGVPLDPWQADHPGYAEDLWRRLRSETSGAVDTPPAEFCRRLNDQVSRFVRQVRAMMDRDGLIPDLAGVRNLLVTHGSRVLLVDINNIYPVVFDAQVPLDDKGYPVLDRSIDALERLGRVFLGRSMLSVETDYRLFFSRERQSRVRELEARFRTMSESA